MILLDLEDYQWVGHLQPNGPGAEEQIRAPVAVGLKVIRNFMQQGGPRHLAREVEPGRS